MGGGRQSAPPQHTGAQHAQHAQHALLPRAIPLPPPHSPSYLEQHLWQPVLDALPRLVDDLDAQAREQMMSLTGRRTVPQIFIGDTHVGGCDELMALDQRGGLQAMLQNA